MINVTRNIIINDLHGIFVDKKALKTALNFIMDYRPDILVINGDLVDFYGLSRFDKNPERKLKIQDELDETIEILNDLRNAVGRSNPIIYIEGNHEVRLQRFIWTNPSLVGLKALQLPNMLELEKFNIQFIGVENDYWKATSGHYSLGNMLIMHGDCRLNGASSGKYSGYSVRNTMFNMCSSVAMGHTHKLGMVFHRHPKGINVGLETGCLCQYSGVADWQQGFVSFESLNGEIVNPKIYNIHDGHLYTDKAIYTDYGKSDI